MSNFEFEQVDHITVGALGPPGERTFMLQATSGDTTVGLVVEKSQVLMLARGMHILFSQIGYSDPLVEPDPDEMAIKEEVIPLFRTGSINIGYEETRDLIMIECEELPESAGEERQEDATTARFWITRAQLAALGIHGMKVAAAGRPVCPYCWRPIDDPASHFCRATNGHDKRALGFEEGES